MFKKTWKKWNKDMRWNELEKENKVRASDENLEEDVPIFVAHSIYQIPQYTRWGKRY